MVRNTFALLVALCIALVSADETADLIQKLVHHREFEVTMGKVALELELFKARDAAMNHAGSPKGVDCLKAMAEDSKAAGEQFIREKIDAVAPKLDAMNSIVQDAASSPQQLDEAAAFARQHTYESYKAACRKTLIKVIPEWVAAKRKDFETCYEH
uniref:Venom protein family 1 protein 1 n=2 Tax=Panheteroptera TaxID=33351 RepID=A0A2K8JL98_9HEMI|nr:venom protein family 1 protein 1 [Lethocerus distinctifemur]